MTVNPTLEHAFILTLKMVVTCCLEDLIKIKFFAMEA
jgi:hypothetical protein